MKVTLVQPPPTPTPPVKVLIELELDQAQELHELMNKIGVSSESAIYGPVCKNLSDEERAADKHYGGHHWQYKRVVDALANHLSEAISHLK